MHLSASFPDNFLNVKDSIKINLYLRFFKQGLVHVSTVLYIISQQLTKNTLPNYISCMLLNAFRLFNNAHKAKKIIRVLVSTSESNTEFGLSNDIFIYFGIIIFDRPVCLLSICSMHFLHTRTFTASCNLTPLHSISHQPVKPSLNTIEAAH